MATTTSPNKAAPTTRLRRELRLFETIAVSLGIMAPTAVLALNGVLPASLVGSGVGLVLVIASVGIAFVAYGFIRMAQQFAHAGSVYAFAGRTLGPRAGFFAGWAILATYVCFTAGSTAEVGLFGGTFLNDIGVNVDWVVIALVAGILISAVAFNDIRVITRALLSIEGVAIILIVVLLVIVLVNILGGSAPRGQTFTLKPFTLPTGIGLSTAFLAAVGGFLSFAGFEGAATLGEESLDPRKSIPRALLLIVAGTTIFFTFGFFVQTIGFGVDKVGVHQFATSSNSLADLGRTYVGSGLSDAMSLAATLSAFGSALGTAIAASRVLFALGRDGFMSRRLGETAGRTGAPVGALAVVMSIAFVVIIAQRVNGTTPVNAFFYPGTIGVLLVLVAYIVTTLGTIRFFFFGRRVRLWEIVVPLGALGILGYTLYHQIFPTPPYPYNRFPYYAAVYLVIGILITFVVPGFARRVGDRLARETDEGPVSTEPVVRAPA